ncbi:orotate phosphoribosyltransferase [Elusimicrobiota bacterium]
MDTEILKKTGAIKKGHFLLASGLHSEFYFQAQSLLQHPRYASLAGEEIAELWKEDRIDVVVSLAIGGIVLGQEVARHLNCRHIFVERKNREFSLQRGFCITPRERTLLVEDVITTGGSLKEALELLSSYSASIIGITSMVIRGNPELPYPLKYLIELDWHKYEPDECPLCKNNIELYTPGSKQSKK